MPPIGQAAAKARRRANAPGNGTAKKPAAPPSSSRTSRLVVLLSPAEKTRLERKAAAAEASVGALVRRALDAYEPEAANEEAQLRALLAAVKDSHDTAMRALDEAEEELRRTRAYFDLKRDARAEEPRAEPV